ncbi:hypothetical protein F5141DRAFT_1221621 [Pisolithus sp. B1]|nr:hypothetical protein F5141DRAFT_1221621 [Pisolithus sp. B1]
MEYSRSSTIRSLGRVQIMGARGAAAWLDRTRSCPFEPYLATQGRYTLLFWQETEAFLIPHTHTVDNVGERLASYDTYEGHRFSAQDCVTVRVPISLAEETPDTKHHVYPSLSDG